MFMIIEEKCYVSKGQVRCNTHFLHFFLTVDSFVHKEMTDLDSSSLSLLLRDLCWGSEVHLNGLQAMQRPC